MEWSLLLERSTIRSNQCVRRLPEAAWTQSLQSSLTSLLLSILTMLWYFQTLEKHVNDVKQVFNALNEAGIILNFNKCKFFATNVRFPSHIVSADGVKSDHENIQKDLNWPVPHTITDVCGFNNLANHYACYIKNFAELALPLTDLQKESSPKGTEIEWTTDC